jgi:hypothetical protein
MAPLMRLPASAVLSDCPGTPAVAKGRSKKGKWEKEREGKPLPPEEFRENRRSDSFALFPFPFFS